MKPYTKCRVFSKPYVVINCNLINDVKGDWPKCCLWVKLSWCDAVQDGDHGEMGLPILGCWCGSAAQQCLFGLEVCEGCSLVSGTAHTVCPVEFQSSGLRTDSSGFRFGICFSKFNCCFVGFVGFFCWIHVCLAPEPDWWYWIEEYILTFSNSAFKRKCKRWRSHEKHDIT